MTYLCLTNGKFKTNKNPSNDPIKIPAKAHNATVKEVKGVLNISNTMTLSSTNARSMPLNVNNNFGIVDALPKQFIASMKKLFDILDDKHTGYVRYSDIEKGWQDDGCKGLPRGVLDSLKKLTPSNGLLSFERFCAGLKLCLLRNQTDTGNTGNPPTVHTLNSLSNSKCKSPHRNRSPRPPSLQIENPLMTSWNSSGNLTATIRPRNHIVTAQRTLSLPQVTPDSSELDGEIATVNINRFNTPPPPPKPPRAISATNSLNKRQSTGVDKSGIRHALRNSQMSQLHEIDASQKLIPAVHSISGACGYFTNRGSADGGSSSATDSATSATALGAHAKKTSSNSGNKRRHTLQNGIDYNMLRRLKQYEEEREVLLLGLDAVEKTRDWYLQQLESVQGKIRCLGRMGDHVDHWSEVQQERIHFQRARVLEVNRSLATLADSGWEQGCFPFHFNLATSHASNNLTSKPRINRREDHSLYLLPSDDHYILNDPQVKRLEREKQTLLRELFELRRCSPSRRLTPQTQSSPVCSTSSAGGLVDADVVY